MEFGRVPPKIDCWIDAFEMPDYQGKHRRIFGPAHFVSFRGSGPERLVQINSLAVGPKAFLRLFSSQNPQETIRWLTPGDSIEQLNQPNFDADFDSLQILPRAPAEGDTGYEHYRTDP